jgi:hypothetical protein
MRAGAELAVKQGYWKNAAIGYGCLSELELSLGRILDAVADGVTSVAHADRSGDTFQSIVSRSILADALHQQREIESAAGRFAEAEAMQAESQPQYPLLSSLAGFRYCDLLLAGAERAAWGGRAGPTAADLVAVCEAVAGRAGQTLEWIKAQGWLLDEGLDHLTLARCALYADRLQGRPPGPEAQAQADQAVAGLRAAGQQIMLPHGLLTRAWLRHALGDRPGAQADLAEVERIAARGGMALHLADLALTRARLFRDPAALAAARRLIEAHHYDRRLPELADAEAHWERRLPAG